jgi:2'-5' RNA ligase
MSETTRAFLAILLPPELIEATARLQEQVQAVFPAGAVRWVSRENFHLTVRFFGYLDRKALRKATEVVESLEGQVPSIRARLAGVSAFPSLTRPQTLWAAVEDGRGLLDEWAGQVDRRIREAGFGPSDKPWKSHLTLGRVGRERTLRMPPDWTAGLTWVATESTISTIALMQSELRPQGPRYTPLRAASASS